MHTQCNNQRAAAAAAALLLLLLVPGAVGETVGFGELEEQWRGEVQQISWRPRAFLLKGFLSDAEADHIASLAQPKLEPSLVVDRETLEWKRSPVRSSSGAAFGRGFDAVLQRIEKRIATVSMIPVEHQEGLQVLHYKDGQEYKAHFDAFYENYGQEKEKGGQRVLTMLMYLSTPEEGGETVFPDAERKVSGPGWSDCALQGLAVKAVKGDALMFYSLTPDGKLDKSSLHASCPTLKGTKWTCTKWIHIHPMGFAPPAEDPDCRDMHQQCAEWAFFDECSKTPKYMHVNCRKSCKLCTPFAHVEAAAAVEPLVPTESGKAAAT